MHIFSTSKKDHTFSYEKVVITQFDASCWFYTPIYAKWLPLKTCFKNCETLWKSGVFTLLNKPLESYKLSWVDKFHRNSQSWSKLEKIGSRRMYLKGPFAKIDTCKISWKDWFAKINSHKISFESFQHFKWRDKRFLPPFDEKLLT